jgi:hypothetical protein
MRGKPRPTLSPRHGRILRKQAIDENNPGTILRDFEALLGFVRGRELGVSKTHYLLSRRALPEINALLVRPVQLGLKRPQLKSYPHIQGLYLLLRASGLADVRGAASKPFLVVDDAVYRAWSNLNPTERYFTLLETWLLRGRPGIVGEYDRSFRRMGETFVSLVNLFDRIPEGGLQVAGDSDAELRLRYTPGLYHLALGELFGLLTVRHGQPQEGKGWQIERVYRTPFGEALLSLLHVELFSDWDKTMDVEERVPEMFGVLQFIFQPYFPAWRANLSVPAWTFREGVHVFQVSLGRVWRRIAVPARASLDALAGAILNAYQFDHDHLYEFSYRNRFGVWERAMHPAMDEGPSADEVRVGDVPLQVGQRMTYLYDFGDSWRFDVALERVEAGETESAKPVILDGRGKAPEQYP